MVRARIQQLYEKKQQLPLAEAQLLRVDGTEFSAEVTAASFIHAGHPMAQVVARDISERKRAEMTLRESEERFRSLTAMSSDFYWESDAEHRLLARGPHSKPAIVSAFANDAQVGLRRWEIPYLSPDEAGWRAHQAVLDARRPFRNFELSRLGPDGTTYGIFG